MPNLLDPDTAIRALYIFQNFGAEKLKFWLPLFKSWTLNGKIWIFVFLNRKQTNSPFYSFPLLLPFLVLEHEGQINHSQGGLGMYVQDGTLASPATAGKKPSLGWNFFHLGLSFCFAFLTKGKFFHDWDWHPGFKSGRPALPGSIWGASNSLWPNPTNPFSFLLQLIFSLDGFFCSNTYLFAEGSLRRSIGAWREVAYPKQFSQTFRISSFPSDPFKLLLQKTTLALSENLWARSNQKNKILKKGLCLHFLQGAGAGAIFGPSRGGTLFIGGFIFPILTLAW